MPKKVQTSVQLHSFHVLARLYLKSFKLGFSCMWAKNVQMYKLGLERAEEPEIKLPTVITSCRKQGNLKKKKKSICFINYMKAFDSVEHKKLWKILKEMGIPDNLTCLLRNLHVGQEATELDMEQLTGSKFGRNLIRLYTLILLI